MNELTAKLHPEHTAKREDLEGVVVVNEPDRPYKQVLKDLPPDFKKED